MVHIGRLMSSGVIASSCAITLFNIWTMCFAQSDINRNLVRDPLELGNPYRFLNNRVPHNSEASVERRKHPNHHRQHVQTEAKYFEDGSRDSTESNSFPVNDSEESVPRIKPNRHENSGKAEDCPLCEAARRNARLGEDAIRQLQIERIKDQILKKLRLKEPPKTSLVPASKIPALPTIFHNDMHSGEEEEEEVGHMDLEDFYGKPEQTIILPDEEIPDCSSWSASRHPHLPTPSTSCFVFKIPKTIRSNQISSAELWVYKLSDSKASSEDVDSDHDDEDHDGRNYHEMSIAEMRTVSNYRMESHNKRRGSIHFNTIVDRNDIHDTAGWVSFNITDRARKWLVTDLHDHTIRITCPSCNVDTNELGFATSGDLQPFIVFRIASGKKLRRQRRSINCSAGVTECCRQSLQISFRAIGWGWVLAPAKFDAYYCKGACHGDIALAHTQDGHSNIMVDYLKSRGGVNNHTVEMVPCCTATKMRSMSISFLQENRTITTTILPNMIIDSCGCK